MVIDDPFAAGVAGAIVGAVTIGFVYLVVRLWRLPIETTMNSLIYTRLTIIFAAMPIMCTLFVALRAMLANGPIRVGWIAGDVAGLTLAIGWWWYRRRMVRRMAAGHSKG